jgi:hypothetical protein
VSRPLGGGYSERQCAPFPALLDAPSCPLSDGMALAKTGISLDLQFGDHHKLSITIYLYIK